jgi:hypothetical protein
MLKALVLTPNEKTTEVGSILAIARAEACRREQVRVNPTVRALVFVAEVGVYVAVYEVSEKLALNNQSRGLAMPLDECAKSGLEVS